MVKASDVRSVFGRVSQDHPLYRHAAGEKTVLVKGIDTPALKFKPSICQKCNNARTQPHDLAWQALCDVVRSTKPAFRSGDRVPMRTAFARDFEGSKVALQLYFLKLLGCHAVEGGAPLPVHRFGAHILSGQPSPDLRLIFVSVRYDPSRYPPIQAGKLEASSGAARFSYRIDSLGVFVVYTEPGFERLSKDRGWHPEDSGVPRFA